MADNVVAAADADAVVKAVGLAADPISRALARGIMYGEDMLRYKVFSALPECGIDADRLTLEYPHPAIKGAKVDTVILNDAIFRGMIFPETAIEFKYHRKSAAGDMPRAMKAGELVNDFVRLRDFKGVNHYVVYLSDEVMIKHMRKPKNGLSALLDPWRERTIPDDGMLAKEAKGFSPAAGDLTILMRLRMRAHWDVGSGHTLIVWQVWPA